MRGTGFRGFARKHAVEVRILVSSSAFDDALEFRHGRVLELAGYRCSRYWLQCGAEGEPEWRITLNHPESF